MCKLHSPLPLLVNLTRFLFGNKSPCQVKYVEIFFSAKKLFLPKGYPVN